MIHLFNYIITIFAHICTFNYVYTNLYTIKYILDFFTFIHIHIINYIAVINIPTPTLHIEPIIYTNPDYICSKDVCEIHNIYSSYYTMFEHLANIIFHLFLASTIPILTKYIADNIANYFVQRINNIITCLTIRFEPYQRLQIEDNRNFHHTIPIDFVQPPEFPFFPHHISGHLPPVRQQIEPQSFGQLVSVRNIRDTNTQNTRMTAISRLVNMSLLSTLVNNHTHHNHDNDDDDNDDDTYAGILTHVDPEYVQTSIQTFVSDACPICMVTFPILELNKNTLAATTPCKHLFCHACIDKYINNHSMAQVPCPICRDIVEELYINK